MKRKNLLKILVLFILAGTIANAEYFKENGEIYYIMNLQLSNAEII